jgi:hypothetical protein
VAQPTSQRPSDPRIGIEAIQSATRIVVTILEGIFDAKVLISLILVVGACYLGTLMLVPEAGQMEAIDRFVAIMRGFGELAHGTVTLLAWLALVVVVVLGGIVIYVQHGRIKQLGEELADLRKLEDPLRVSSRSPDDFAARMERTEKPPAIEDQ